MNAHLMSCGRKTEKPVGLPDPPAPNEWGRVEAIFLSADPEVILDFYLVLDLPEDLKKFARTKAKVKKLPERVYVHPGMVRDGAVFLTESFGIRLDTRPGLAALVEGALACDAARRAADAAWAAEVSGAIRRARAEKLDAYRATIPADHAELEVRHNPGAADGWGRTDYSFDGEDLSRDRCWMQLRDLGMVVHWVEGVTDRPVAHAPRAALEALVESRRAARREKREARERREAEERARYADLVCTVVQRGVSRGEEDDPFALVEVRPKAGGEALRFTCRNIFDFGYTVNPAYPIEPGRKPGGLANVEEGTGRRFWQDYRPDEGGWVEVRTLTDFEAHALDYLHAYPPIEDRIRM